MSYLKNKRIWLIGASEGIGRCLAQQLANQGAVVIVSARNAARIEELRQSLPGDNHMAVECDVTNFDSVKAAWVEIKQIDILIFNAGVYTPLDSAAIDYKAAAEMLDVNYSGAMRVLENVLPEFLSLKQGHIVLVASIAAYRGLPGAIGYSASKAAVLALAETLRCDLKDKNLKIQVVNPGFVKTRLTDKNDFKMAQIITPEKAAKYITKGICSNRFEITFPWLFSRLFKIFRIMPYSLYFKIMKTSSQ